MTMTKTPGEMLAELYATERAEAEAKCPDPRFVEVFIPVAVLVERDDDGDWRAVGARVDYEGAPWLYSDGQEDAVWVPEREVWESALLEGPWADQVEHAERFLARVFDAATDPSNG